MDARQRARAWDRRRSYHHSAFSAERIARERSATISVCVPAREEAATIAPVVGSLVELRERGAIDEVVVIDAHSADGTAQLAAAAGADVHQQDDLLPGFGPAAGKGDALWRSLSVLRGEIVCFVDGDSTGFGSHYACGLVGPLVADPEIAFVKGFYRRPFTLGDDVAADGGGRVTELTARPLLNLFYPELAGVRQPLAGEFAGRRALFERLPFSSGYAVEIGLLIDAWRAVGLDALAQADLELRENRHQPLRDLGPMAYAVLRAVATRLEREGRLTQVVAGELLQAGPGGGFAERTQPLVERPPLATVY